MERFYPTSIGLEYVAQTAMGKVLKFTRGKFGDGIRTNQNIASMTDLISPLGELPISKKGVKDSTITVTTQFSNMVDGNLLSTFYLSEAGLFGKLVNADGTDIPEYPEALLGYVFDNPGDKIPGEILTEFIVNFPLTVSDTKNVIVKTSSIAYTPQKDFDKEVDERQNTEEYLKNNKSNLTYCTCDTTVSTAEKIAEIAAGTFELKEGASVEVKFKYTNTATAPTLNVNGTGAKPIKAYGTTAPDIRMWQAKSVVRFTYDGENWLMVNGTKASTSYYGVTRLSSSVSSTSTSEAATPSAVKSAYDLANNAIPKAQRGAVNGVASLDADGKVPFEQIPEGVGVLPRLEVIAASGTTVEVSDKDGHYFFNKISDGTAVFDLPCFGEWDIYAGEFIRRFTIDTVKVYKIFTLPLSDATWAQIAEVSESGNAEGMWLIGDEKDITVGDETLTLVIVGFNHDNLADGSGKAGITFGLKHLMSETRTMNSTNTNVGGFTGSEMYEWLQGDLLNSLPQDLKAVLKSVNKKTSAGNKDKTINTDAMKVFLFSEFEVFGSTAWASEGEGEHYPYFATTAQKTKLLSNGTGSNSFWWERSPVQTDVEDFCGVSGFATQYYAAAKAVWGVCFGFCV